MKRDDVPVGCVGLPDGSRSDVLQHLAARCTFARQTGPLDCAFSGGPDSTALIALARIAGHDVIAHHVDHGLRPTSANEAHAARLIAEQLGCRFELHQIAVPLGPNLEARARDARFAVLPEGVATGHTQDDQAETFLIRLMRGSGTTGLAAMDSGPRHPIIGLRRRDTVRVCQLLGIEPVQDPTNDVDSPEGARQWRARTRHELVPLLADISGRDPVPIVTRTAALLAEDDALLSDLAAAIDPTDCAALRQAPTALARRALRGWLTRSGYPPDACAIDRVLSVATGTAVACEIAGGIRVARSGGRLRVGEPGQ